MRKLTVLLAAFLVLGMLALAPSTAAAQCVEAPSPATNSTSYVGTGIWRFASVSYKGNCRASGMEAWFDSSNFICTLGTMYQGPCAMEASSDTGVQITQYECGTYTARYEGRWLLFSSGNCPPPPPQDWKLGCDDENPAYSMWWDFETEQYQCSSPILISTNGAPYRLTSVANGVLFDINADGVVDRVAWTHVGDELGWLAFDANGNGVIDNGKELLGSHTNEGWNGFEALANIQLAAIGKRRSVLDADDAIYHRLLLWTDRNHDGVSQPSELEKFSKNFSAIQMGYQPNNTPERLDEYGNSYALKGEAIRRTQPGKNPVDFYNRDRGERTTIIYDVWLKFSSRQ